MNKLIEGQVDRKSEHFELTHGSVDSDEGFLEVVLLGRVNEKEFHYQFLPNVSEDVKKKVLKNLNFYMVEKGEENAWNYAKHHTGTASNLYSKVHWDFYPANFFENKKAAVEIAEPELLKLYPDFREDGLEVFLMSVMPGRENGSVWTVKYAAKGPGAGEFLIYTGADIRVDLSTGKVVSVKESKDYKESDRIANQLRSS